MLENTFDSTQSSDDIDSIVVQLPKFTVVSLRGPPERTTTISVSGGHEQTAHDNSLVLEELILLPVGPNTPSFVVSESMSILLEESVAESDRCVSQGFERTGRR